VNALGIQVAPFGPRRRRLPCGEDDGAHDQEHGRETVNTVFPPVLAGTVMTTLSSGLGVVSGLPMTQRGRS